MPAPLREAVALGKDVVFYKAGRTSEGAVATAGHTASVAGDYAVCEAAVAQAGAFVADDFNEFSDLLSLAVHLRGKTVARQPPRWPSPTPASSRWAWPTRSGSDGAELRLASSHRRPPSALRQILAEHRLDGLVDVKNPFDVTPMATDAAFADLVAEFSRTRVDVVVAGIVPLTPAMQTLAQGARSTESIDNPGSVASCCRRSPHEYDTPLVAVVDSGTRSTPWPMSSRRAACRSSARRPGSAGLAIRAAMSAVRLDGRSVCQRRRRIE